MVLEAKVRHVLKTILKDRGMSYRDLSVEMRVSESSVKRLMSSRKMSLNELERVCRFLDVPPNEILQLAFEARSELVSLTWEQEDFLCRNPKTDYIFLRLMFGFSPEQIAREMNLPAREFNLRVKSLERNSLVKIRRNGAISALKRGPFSWVPDGPFEKKFKHQFFTFVSGVFARKLQAGDQNCLAHAFELYISEESGRKLVFELNEILLKYKKISKIDQAVLKTESLSPYSVCIAAGKHNSWKGMLLDDPE